MTFPLIDSGENNPMESSQESRMILSTSRNHVIEAIKPMLPLKAKLPIRIGQGALCFERNTQIVIHFVYTNVQLYICVHKQVVTK